MLYPYLFNTDHVRFGGRFAPMDQSALAKLLTRHEGIRLNIYQDTKGKWSVGVGHNLSDKGLTLMQVENILEDDIRDTIAFLNLKLPWWQQLDEVRQLALADLAFDLMGKLLGFHHMLDALQAKDWPRASQELLNSAFASETGQRAKDIAQMFRTGQSISL